MSLVVAQLAWTASMVLFLRRTLERGVRARPVGRYDPGVECVLAGAMESGGRGLPINVAPR